MSGRRTASKIIPLLLEGAKSTSEALVRIGLNLIFQTIQFTSKGLLGKL